VPLRNGDSNRCSATVDSAVVRRNHAGRRLFVWLGAPQGVEYPGTPGTRSVGRYEALDFLALLFGYAISGEWTLQAFFDRLQPFTDPFMALFERREMPHRSTLSRFLSAVVTACLEALRSLFMQASLPGDGLRRPLAVCGIDLDATICSLTSMPHARLPVSANFPLVLSSLGGGNEYPGDGSCRQDPGSPPVSPVRRDDGPHSFPRCFFAWAQSPCAV
jgi:hypothetical protein